MRAAPPARPSSAVGAALPVALLAALLTACTGASCAELPDLRAERDAARTAYGELLRTGTADVEETERADTGVHALDRRVYDLEQTC